MRFFFSRKKHAQTACYGCAAAMGHTGEYLQGQIDHEKMRISVLVTIPAPELLSRATFFPDGRGSLHVFPIWKRKALLAFTLAWRELCGGEPSGLLTVESDLPKARGLGSSTADCVAAMRAAASSLHGSLSEQQIARLAHLAEQNSDATMFGDELVVFRHREGLLHSRLPATAPGFDRVIVEQAHGRRRIDTNQITRPRYTDLETSEFTELLARIHHACANADLAEIGRVAERSADINQRYHPMPGLRELRSIAHACGASGVAIAHSGDIQTLLFPPGRVNHALHNELTHALSAQGMRIWRTLAQRLQQHATQP